jgi:hypothetical protein
MVEKINQSELRDALLRSGYLLESRLQRVLTRRNYYVSPNVPYLDSKTQKTRELDLRAMKLRSFGTQYAGRLYPTLLIECINNPQPVAFIEQDSDPSSDAPAVQMAGLPLTLFPEDTAPNGVDFISYFRLAEFHHYGTGEPLGSGLRIAY